MNDSDWTDFFTTIRKIVAMNRPRDKAPATVVFEQAEKNNATDALTEFLSWDFGDADGVDLGDQ